MFACLAHDSVCLSAYFYALVLNMLTTGMMFICNLAQNSHWCIRILVCLIYVREYKLKEKKTLLL
jgi:hypothetical protein